MYPITSLLLLLGAHLVSSAAVNLAPLRHPHHDPVHHGLRVISKVAIEGITSHHSLSPADKAATTACIDTSLSYPRWEITNMVFTVVNYSQAYTIGDVAFTAHNPSINLSTNCWAEDIELSGSSDAWHSCTVPGTDFQFRLGTYDLKMRGSWDCGENDVRAMQFKAGGVGNTAGIRRCDDFPYEARGWETRCIMDDSAVAAGLSSPVAIEPQQPLLPEIPEGRARSCTDRSATPAWDIVGFEAKSDGVLKINVTNLSNDQGLSCETKLDSKSKWVDCVDANSKDIVSTGLMFDGEHGILGIKQTWKCPTENYWGSSVGPYTGIAYLTTPQLKCTACSLAESTTLRGYINGGPGIPHTSYVRSCTLNSFNSTSIILKDYDITSNKVGTFSLYNQGSGDIYKIAGVTVSDDGAWHDCNPSEALPWQLDGCQYSLDAAHEKLGFRVKWDCDDRDPLHPIIFSAEASASLPEPECATDSCGLAKDSKGVELAISSLTWASSKKPMEKGPLLPWI
ncbi:hypothetical protein V8F20_008272 [Naviculisporaceae sp. PSN 640]